MRIADIVKKAEEAGIITSAEGYAIAAAVLHVDDEKCDSFAMEYGSIAKKILVNMCVEGD